MENTRNGKEKVDVNRSESGLRVGKCATRTEDPGSVCDPYCSSPIESLPL